MQCLSTMSSRRRTRSAAFNTPEDATVDAPPAKKGKGRSKRSARGTVGAGSVSGDRQADFMTRDDIPSIVQAVCDALSRRNFSNAVTPTSGTPVNQGVEAPPTQQSTNVNRQQEDGELLLALNILEWTDTISYT